MPVRMYLLTSFLSRNWTKELIKTGPNALDIKAIGWMMTTTKYPVVKDAF